ncbi:phosphoribosylglycinamide formyltransferase [uncultured Alistipes sp.]|uniref:phosphoribosylglycinamide formyltransferase n=1 Tax=uncultured Alistipes sp. TaxID=538949 RepID=UPI00262151D9|nr:phosphoribosylglycinamide formyltransferase [uncultured Alistipes sp.]
MKRLAVFASGNGTNFEAIVSAAERGDLPAQVVLLVCDRPGARVVERAAAHGVETLAFAPKEYASKADYEAEIVRRLDAAGVELVCLAGYMRIVGETLLGAYGGRIINIHPSLLPAFRGAHAIEQALAYGVRVFGVTIHYVDATLDGGRIIAQRAFEYDGGDRAELEAKIHAVEHPLYVETIRRLLEEQPAAAKSER